MELETAPGVGNDYQTTWDDINRWVDFYGQIIDHSVAVQAAKEAYALYKFARAERIVNTRNIVHLAASDPSFRMLRVVWNCAQPLSRDGRVIDEVLGFTGVDISTVLTAARALTEAANQQATEQLTIFKTDGTLEMHRDAEDAAELHNYEFIPDETLVRDILHLRGRRRLSLAASYEAWPVERSFRPGEAYGIHPEMVYHGLEYSQDSLGLYVQGYVH